MTLETRERTKQRTTVESRYRGATPTSQKLYERATRSLPGGNSRTTVYFQPYPWYFSHGEGCYVYDVDGNRWVDFINNYSSLILGHCHAKVVDVVQQQASQGLSVAAPTELEVELAEIITERVPSVDRIRFANSGTEGTMMALRAARAFTGRDKILKFDGGYHGTHDYAAVKVAGAAGAVGAGTETQNAGIPAAVAETVVTVPYNDKNAVKQAVVNHRQDLAAIIAEPVMGAAGIIVPQDGFLEFLRDLTEEEDILLIFDEVIAFRISYHGAQGYFGVTPDLTTFGKIIGGGFPVGAFGGREDIMARFDPRHENYIGHGGTFNANPMAMRAGIATLQELTPETYQRLNALGAALKEKLDALFDTLDVSAHVNQIGSLFNIHFTEDPPTDYQAVQDGNRELLQSLYLTTHNYEVTFTPRGMGCLSVPMTRAEIDTFVDAVKAGLTDLSIS